MSTTEIKEKAVENIAEVLSSVEGLTDKLEVKTSEFKTKLSEMGVEVVEGDNLSTLIDKFKGMSAGKKWASGITTNQNPKKFDTYNNYCYCIIPKSQITFTPNIILVRGLVTAGSYTILSTTMGCSDWGRLSFSKWGVNNSVSGYTEYLNKPEINLINEYHFPLDMYEQVAGKSFEWMAFE